MVCMKELPHTVKANRPKPGPLAFLWQTVLGTGLLDGASEKHSERRSLLGDTPSFVHVVRLGRFFGLVFAMEWGVHQILSLEFTRPLREWGNEARVPLNQALHSQQLVDSLATKIKGASCWSKPALFWLNFGVRMFFVVFLFVLLLFCLFFSKHV